MSSTSPSPNSSPSAVSPTSSDTTTPPPSNSSTTPTTTATPSDASPPPAQSPPPASPASPSPKSSPPPSTPPPTSPPPSPPAAPPPSSPPPASPPPSPPAASPTAASAPPPDASPPPPSESSPPPKSSPTPPAEASPPPKSTESPPPSSNSPTPPQGEAPKKSPSSPTGTPPPSASKSAPAPADKSPPASTVQSPPPSVPSSSSPPVTSPTLPSNSSNPTPLPQKPTARSTTDANVTSNATSGNKGGLDTGGAVAIGIVVGFLVISLLVMAVWFAKKQKKRKAGANLAYSMPSPFASSQNSDSAFLKPYSPAPLVGNGSGSDFMYAQSDGGVNNSKSWFTYEELIKATNGFSKQNLLGEGGFGCVYKGVLEDEREVAVKQLKIGGGQGEREFKAEVEIISRVHHRHLVSLVGYCISEHQRLLVYDFVPNDTLHYHLHAAGEGMPVLDWATRVKVAAGAARGIAYLHEDCHPRIIHRDIKSSNILLDSNFEAQVADFGLAKLALDSNTHVTTRVMGTFGYMAPEYATSGKLTDKSDVYSYGVVLLELITGRKPVDSSQPLGDESLVEWARPLLSQALEGEDLEGLADPRLEKNYVENEMFRMIEAASACVRHSATKRPRMRQVVRAFDSLDEFSDLSNGMKPGESEIFNSAEHSAQIRMFQRMAFGSEDNSTGFFNQSQSSWKSRDSREQGYQNQRSWASRDSREHGDQTQSSWSRDQRDPRNPSTAMSIDRSGIWNN